MIEDLPGMGKTLLSHALARVLGLSFNRIQFTSDVLPGDNSVLPMPGRSSINKCPRANRHARASLI